MNMRTVKNHSKYTAPYNFADLIDFLGIDNSDTDEMGDDYDAEEDEER